MEQKQKKGRCAAEAARTQIANANRAPMAAEYDMYLVEYTSADSMRTVHGFHSDWRAIVKQFVDHSDLYEPLVVRAGYGWTSDCGVQMLEVAETIKVSGSNTGHPADRSVEGDGPAAEDIGLGLRVILDMEADNE